MSNQKVSGVLVLDFGSQYTQLIARRIRELNVYSEVKPCTLNPAEYDTSNVKAIILSGGPASVTDADAPSFNPEWLNLGLPILGVCYGMQLISHLMGGKLASGGKREYGRANLEVKEASPLFSGFELGEKTAVWMSHGDHVEVPPQGFKVIASSESLPVAAIANDEKKIYALQFHPEVVHSARGTEIIKNFVQGIAGCAPDWTAAGFIETKITEIRSTVSHNANVICGISGGVDSSVAAVLVNRAIGGNLHCIFVDNGLLRKNEGAKVMQSLGQGMGLNIKYVDASKRFLEELKGVTSPEEKRKIIGRVFIEVFDEEAAKIPNVTHLVQGTLYPDVIESTSVRGPSATIKSHHNVGGLPEKMNLKLIEPLRELFKDEVRKIGRELGIPEENIKRQPFPGPGLAVRIVGEITEDRHNVLREADAIFMDEIRSAGLYDTIWQSFVALLPVRSVGVMGDNRTYEQTAALRAVYSQDGMTADWCYLPEDLLRRVSNRIINEVAGI
ncbi:glutamine-hydrolyzing GMP synthase, partial [bacterium]|nr:glutamine-hydrolyzing GMP synthase [bacterium]